MSLPFVLNIGWARAGSTAFRHNFLRQHPQIISTDRGQPPPEGPAGMTLGVLKNSTSLEFQLRLPGLRAQWEAFTPKYRDRVICLSDEELSIGRPGGEVRPVEIAARCRELFPRARTLAIVRDQADAIRSLYALAYRVGQAGAISLSDWVRQFFLGPPGSPNFSFLYSYMTTLRAYLEWQPRANVYLLPYHTLKNDHTTAYRDIARWLGISENACAALLNERVNVSPPIPLPVPGGPREHAAAGAAPSAPNDYSPGQEAAIRDLFQSENAELEREFGITFRPPAPSDQPAPRHPETRHAV